MKKKIAIVLSFVLLFTLVVPAGGFAANMDKALENAIKIAKTKFTVPSDYKFSSSISTENKKSVFNLNWRSPDTVESSSINVRITEDGIIVGYNKYSQSDYVQTKKLPKLSKQDAKAKADAYIKGIEPGLLEDLWYEDNYQGNVMDISYYLSYYRVVNGVPYYNDRVTVNINRETGALQDYSRQLTGDLTFPAPAGSISVSQAQQAYAKNMGMKLIYKYTQAEEALKAFAVYVPVYNNGNYAINAFTGERQRIYNNYYYGYNDGVMLAASKESARAAAPDIQLNPDEMKAVQDAAKLMSKEEAEKVARNAKFLNIAADSKLQSYYLSANWPEKDQYVWSLQFNKPAGDKSKYDEYTSVTVNAKSGEIVSFYRGAPTVDVNSAPAGKKTDMATAKAAVEAFLKEYYPQYFRQMEYDEQTSESYLAGPSDTNYNIKYSRLVNGTAFPDNGVNTNYDAASGTIIGFNLSWFNISFPSVDKAIGVPAATDKLLKNVGLALEYKLEYDDNADRIKTGIPAGTAENPKVTLVYALSPNKPLILDANTGNLLNADGSAYKEAVRVNYTDIKGNAAEKQIMVLADNGIYLEGTEFKPNAAITQKDFLTLLSKTLSYYGPVITAKSSEKDVEEMYAFLQREGIVKAGEKAPSDSVTRETAVKFLIRALKYDKVADIKGIYNISFKDKSSIDASLTGYIAIAAGLGIVDSKSESLKPKAKLTRGESAVMIYNYLQL